MACRLVAPWPITATCLHLPVWKAAMDMAVHLEHAVRRFRKTPSPPRCHKYTLGTELHRTVQTFLCTSNLQRTHNL
jgi:hypothetical protein